MRQYVWLARSRSIRLLYSPGAFLTLATLPRFTAVSRLQARTLAREEFLAAVTGNAASAEGADEVVSARLRAR